MSCKRTQTTPRSRTTRFVPLLSQQITCRVIMCNSYLKPFARLCTYNFVRSRILPKLGNMFFVLSLSSAWVQKIHSTNKILKTNDVRRHYNLFFPGVTENIKHLLPLIQLGFWPRWIYGLQKCYIFPCSTCAFVTNLWQH